MRTSGKSEITVSGISITQNSKRNKNWLEKSGVEETGGKIAVYSEAKPGEMIFGLSYRGLRNQGFKK